MLAKDYHHIRYLLRACEFEMNKRHSYYLLDITRVAMDNNHWPITIWAYKLHTDSIDIQNRMNTLLSLYRDVNLLSICILDQKLSDKLTPEQRAATKTLLMYGIDKYCENAMNSNY